MATTIKHIIGRGPFGQGPNRSHYDEEYWPDDPNPDTHPRHRITVAELDAADPGIPAYCGPEPTGHQVAELVVSNRRVQLGVYFLPPGHQDYTAKFANQHY